MNIDVLHKYGSPATMINFIFANVSWLFAFDVLGLLGEGSGLIVALCQITFAPVFTAIGLIALKRNDAFSGNTALVFATFFNFMPGVCTIGAHLLQASGTVVSTKPIALCLGFCGVYLLCTLPAIRRSPGIPFIGNVVAGIALVIYALNGFGFFGPWAAPLTGYMFAVVAIISTYSFIMCSNADAGCILPESRPLFK